MSFRQDASHPVEPELLGPAYPIPRLLPFHPSSFLLSRSSLVLWRRWDLSKHLVVGGGGGS